MDSNNKIAYMVSVGFATVMLATGGMFLYVEKESAKHRKQYNQLITNWQDCQATEAEFLRAMAKLSIRYDYNLRRGDYSVSDFLIRRDIEKGAFGNRKCLENELKTPYVW